MVFCPLVNKTLYSCNYKVALTKHRGKNHSITRLTYITIRDQLKVHFLTSQTLFDDLDYIWIFPPKTRHHITWNWHISMYSKSRMMDFRQFQIGKISFLSALDTLKCQYLWKLHIILANVVENIAKNLTLKNILPLSDKIST